jgi:hypothetical protein
VDWTAMYDAPNDLVRVAVQGKVEEQAADQMLRELVALGKQHNAWRFLVDSTRATLAMSVAQIRDRPRHYAASGFQPSARFAVVFSEWTPDAVLLEATIEREHFHRRVFIDVEEALRWLKSDRP